MKALCHRILDSPGVQAARQSLVTGLHPLPVGPARRPHRNELHICVRPMKKGVYFFALSVVAVLDCLSLGGWAITALTIHGSHTVVGRPLLLCPSIRKELH